MKGWREYANVLEKRANALRSKLHGDLRQQMEKQRAERGTRLTRMMQPISEEGSGREGAALTNALRKRRDGAVDSAVIREEGGETGGPPRVRTATSGEEMKTRTLEYLKQWMGWGRPFCFHSPDGRTPEQPMGGVMWPESGGHSIYQDNEQGREFRKSLIEERLTQEDTVTIPECFHMVLKYLERKKTASADVVAAKAYSETGLLKPTSSQKWKKFWARARAGKRGGESELHATLIKAAVKKVFMQTGPDGTSRKVTYTEHVVAGLRQLMNAPRQGRFFYSDWTQELLYTFIKVPGTTGLENSRPVGLPEIMQKASYAFDFQR